MAMRGENFIGVIDNVITEEQCKKVIESFHFTASMGETYTRQDVNNIPKDSKADTSLDIQSLKIQTIVELNLDSFLAPVDRAILDYVKHFESGMFDVPQTPENRYPMSQACTKIQMTRPSEGYHIWHCENGGLVDKSRFIAWILYLNDIDEGGETEFIHLSERVTPKAGRLLVFPAGWTHAHRGNPPLSNTKYIATGWVEYTQ